MCSAFRIVVYWVVLASCNSKLLQTEAALSSYWAWFVSIEVYPCWYSLPETDSICGDYCSFSFTFKLSGSKSSSKMLLEVFCWILGEENYWREVLIISATFISKLAVKSISFDVTHWSILSYRFFSLIWNYWLPDGLNWLRIPYASIFGDILLS